MKCPLCEKGELERKTVLMEYTYKSKSILVGQPGEWCPVCKEGILTHEDLEKVRPDLDHLLDKKISQIK